MKTKTIFLIVVLFSITLLNINAQSTDKKPCPCCTEAHSQFDFWLGEWTVYNTDGKQVGTNLITKEDQYGNCVMREQWKSAGVSRGTSYNYYNLADKTWNQVWIDNSGFSLTLKGSYINGKMTLKSKLLEGKKGTYYNRIPWQLNEDKSVTQTWDILNEQDEITQQAFKGIYKKSVK